LLAVGNCDSPPRLFCGKGPGVGLFEEEALLRRRQTL
jgi:hypothetical protein